jgi:hypothetical protein
MIADKQAEKLDHPSAQQQQHCAAKLTPCLYPCQGHQRPHALCFGHVVVHW